MDRIVIELTERLAEHEYDPVVAALAPLRLRGLRVAVDGAGAGFGSMSQVTHLSPDIIKLDRSLIAGIDHAAGQKTLGAAMVEFARQIGADLVAEGIETQAELTAVMDLGMAYGQGYLLGRPSVQPLDWAAWRTPPITRPPFQGPPARPLRRSLSSCRFFRDALSVVAS